MVRLSTGGWLHQPVEACSPHANEVARAVPSSSPLTSSEPHLMSTADTAAAADSAPDEVMSKAAQKRFQTLLAVRGKARKGKGAWYWLHLEPILVHNPQTGIPTSVKLRCSLCHALFSASNPSRTASEHLKRGTCPNFTSQPTPISSISPCSITSVPSSSSLNHRKRDIQAIAAAAAAPSALAIVDPSRFSTEFQYTLFPSTTDADAAAASASTTAASGGSASQTPFVLSGGKDDLDALAMFEDSVKKLKSPKMSSPVPSLSKPRIDSALDCLAHWIYDSFGSVSLSSLQHPKFRAFLSHVGVPLISCRDFAGARLDAKFEEARIESKSRIRDAMFFQIASDGWKSKQFGFVHRNNVTNLVKFTVNLPNDTTVFSRSLFMCGFVPSVYAEEVLWDAIKEACRKDMQKCVGVVADKGKALRNLENQHRWMVNLSCQLQGLVSLVKDFTRELPLIRTVTDKCRKIADFLNTKAPVRHTFHRYHIQEYGRVYLPQVPSHEFDQRNFGPVYGMLDELLHSSRALQRVHMDETFKTAVIDDPVAQEVAEMIRDSRFWTDLEAVHSLIKLIKDMAEEIETERPLVGQCLLLWDAIRAKVKCWCSKFRIPEGPVEEIIDKRFRKNYHPAWAAAFVLDPLYLIEDNNGKYLPPFKCLTVEQEKDVDRLVTRLVSREEAHIALMELMKWRTEGLESIYARAVQMKERDPITGKMKIANPRSSRLVWETYLTDFRLLAKIAVRLIFLHATSAGFKCNLSFLRWASVHAQSKLAMAKAEKMIFVAAHSKLERRDFSGDEELDAQLFASDDREDYALNDLSCISIPS